MNSSNPSLQDNFPMVMFNTHLARDHVIFTLPLNETLDTLVPLAVELLHMPEACKLLARLAVEDSQLVISIGRNLG
jgi:hypothetical protein